MTECSITRCGNDAVIKGLCRKHYMRLRRNGDATATKTPGPKPREADPLEEFARTMVRDRSPRTLARCRRASTLLLAFGPEITRDASHASVVAKLVPDNWVRKSDRENEIRYDLVWERGRWAIDDVRSVIEPNAWSLRAVLTQYLAALIG